MDVCWDRSMTSKLHVFLKLKHICDVAVENKMIDFSFLLSGNEIFLLLFDKCFNVHRLSSQYSLSYSFRPKKG